MNETTLKRFKKLFEDQKQALLKSFESSQEDLSIQSDDLKDETDFAISEIQRSMAIRLKNRSSLFLKKIDAALMRIQAGTFGLCDLCEEEIELRRLEARPTTSVCVHCKEAEEFKERAHIDGHRHKSVGQALRSVKESLG